MEHVPGAGRERRLSGGEIKRSELLQLEAQNPCLYLLDEPESGVDLVSIEKVGEKVTRPAPGHELRREKGQSGKAALVITHTGQILDYIEADRGYVMCKGTIACSGNPRELLHEIRSRWIRGVHKMQAEAEKRHRGRLEIDQSETEEEGRGGPEKKAAFGEDIDLRQVQALEGPREGGP